MSKGPDAEIDNVSQGGFMAKMKAHMRKWWWLHLIIFCACFLFVALMLVYVGYPRIAQGDVDKSTLEILSMEISNPTPNSFDVSLEQQLGVSSIFRPHLESFVASLSLAGSDKVFMKLTIPALQARDGAVVEVEQHVELEDVAAFTEFAVEMMLVEEVTVNVNGRTGLKLGALPTTEVNYDKTVVMKGLNSLKGFNITEFEITKPEADGANMIGTVFIPNPTIQTLHLGNLTYDLAVKGEPIGISHLYDAVISPGDNYLPMRSKVDQRKVLGYIGEAEDGKLPVEISNGKSVFDGEKLPYFTAALKANKMTVPLALF